MGLARPPPATAAPGPAGIDPRVRPQLHTGPRRIGTLTRVVVAAVARGPSEMTKEVPGRTLYFYLIFEKTS